VGSALVKIIEEDPRKESLLPRMEAFIASLSAALRREK